MTAIDKLIQTADNEVGYLEKSSNSQLDDKRTAVVCGVCYMVLYQGFRSG